jgi:predicted transcriptional regulator of viral defense system
MIELRKKIDGEVFDYQALLEALDAYSAPRDKITKLLRDEVIIRVKKGLYVFGPDYRRRPYSRELLANLIYGPSFVSLEYALAYHGLIPERVEEVTSVTTKRSRKFNTPLGVFSYSATPSLQPGFTRVEHNEDAFLMALPERALADRVRNDRNWGGIRSMKEAEQYLTENLRIDRDVLQKLNHDLMRELAASLRSRKVELCAKWIRKSGDKV